MRFEVVTGNPPYQEMDGGAKASARPLYHKFVEFANDMDAGKVCLVTPSRWFAGGKGLDAFRDSMIESGRMAKLVDFPSSPDCFEGVSIKGGCSSFLLDEGRHELCVIRTVQNGVARESERPLRPPGVDVLVRFDWQHDLLKRTMVWKEESFDGRVSSRKPFGKLESSRIEDAFAPGLVPVYGNGFRAWIRPQPKGRGGELKDAPKIFVSYAYGAGDGYPHQIINVPFVPENDALCMETYLVVGGFATSAARNNALKYMRTKFFRALVSVAKITQHATSKVYRYVPNQDFGPGSKLDWTGTVEEVDERLFDWYEVTEEERIPVREAIRDMPALMAALEA